MAIGKVRTPGLNGHGTRLTPQYSFFGPVRPRESCSVTTCVGSGWFTLKKLPRCTPHTCHRLQVLATLLKLSPESWQTQKVPSWHSVRFQKDGPDRCQWFHRKMA